MTRARIWLSFAIVALAITLPLLQADAAQVAPVQDVKVVNTSSEAVPMKAQGTTTVDGSVAATQSGPWSVGAAQSGTWTVGVTGAVATVSQDTTQTLLATRYTGPTVAGTGEFDSAIVDVTSYRSLRVMVQVLADPATCCTSPIEVVVNAVTSIGGPLFDPTTAMPLAIGGQYLNVAIDTPPPSIRIAAFCRPGPCAMDVLVVGRRN